MYWFQFASSQTEFSISFEAINRINVGQRSLYVASIILNLERESLNSETKQ